MAQAMHTQLAGTPKVPPVDPNKWADDNEAGREQAMSLVEAARLDGSPMTIVSTLRRMIAGGKVTGEVVGFVTALTMFAISQEAED